MIRLGSLLILIIIALAIYDVWKREYNMEKRLLWTVVILLLPIIGAAAWFVTSRGYIKL
jgi:uncharacterized membrane protein YphA (DoxX/SURF4 family)